MRFGPFYLFSVSVQTLDPFPLSMRGQIEVEKACGMRRASLAQ